MLKHLNHPDQVTHLIGGRDVPAGDGARLDVLAPGDGQPFASIAAGSAADIDAAVVAARQAFEGAWGRLTALDRGRLLLKLAAAVEAESEALGALESRDTGKPLRQGRADAAALVRYLTAALLINCMAMLSPSSQPTLSQLNACLMASPLISSLGITQCRSSVDRSELRSLPAMPVS